jgi:hypothetical protein
VRGSVLFALSNRDGTLERCSVQIDTNTIRVVSSPDIMDGGSIAMLQGSVRDWEEFVENPSYQTLARLRIYGDVELFTEFESSVRSSKGVVAFRSTLTREKTRHQGGARR